MYYCSFARSEFDSRITDEFSLLAAPYFVGVGIKGKMEMLETQFGIRCRNAVELGPLAADVLGMPHLRTCGVDKLALEVLGFDLGRRRLVTGLYEDSDANSLSIQQAEFAAVNVCSFYLIGMRLFEKRAFNCANRGRVIRSKNWLLRFEL
ncbi:protein RISC-INTERACTING CLEARING 3'-5' EXORIBONUCLEASE 2 [Vigna umbellata]|uniref:protein RISC-INTERACTING CLEARING 3'-5' EXORIBONUCLEASE 2 n=1 Tax=Vigna umbellata TaxID=87088 RepID=UPI001F5F2B9B|nr:protein RISC-INTERACTING CLEARING 3'-5' EXORIBONUCLEASE 2 [Vigna umbellata]